MRNSFALALVSLVVVASTAEAAPKGPAQPVKVATAEGITEYRLDNGMRFLLFPDETKPTVLVNVTYLVGSRVEGYGETGMAHLLEHMLFKGTPTRPDIWKLLESHGANFNGTTWWDRTNYFEELPASTENLEFALALEADRMVASKIAAEDLAKEFSVVRNEFERIENMPEVVLEDKVLAAAYQWHNYGKSTIGSRSDIERVPVENLRAFYKRYYQPDNALLVIAGRFDQTRALDMVTKYFGAIPRPNRTLQKTWTVEPVQDGEREVTVRRSGDVPIVTVAYHGVAGADPDKVAEDAIVDILTNKPSGRLYKALVESGLATEVSGAAYPMAEPGVMVFSAKLAKNGSVARVRDALVKVVESMGSIRDDEINRWRAGFFRDFDLVMTETAKLGVALSEYAAMGDWRLLFLTRDRVKTTTATDVARVAKTYLKRSNRTLGIFQPTEQPDRAPLATVVDVAAMLKEYKGAGTVQAGEAFVATVENIEKRTTRETLPSGLELAMLPKKTKGGQVRVALTLRFGSEADLRGKVAAAGMVPEMLMRGTRKHTYAELRDKLALLKAEVTIAPSRGSPSTVNVAQIHVKTVRENLSQVLALAAEMLRQPAFPKKEFEALQKETLTKLEEQLTDPMANASVSLMQRLLPYPADDVRHTPSLREAIERVRKVKLSDVIEMHQRLWGSSAAQMSVVGDFDPQAVKNEIAALFDGWKAKKPYARVTLPFLSSRSGDDTIDTPDKEMAFVVAGQSMSVRDEDPAYPALYLFNYMLGGSPSSRLFLRLRQKEGISYGAFSQLLAHPIDRTAFFFAGAIAAPGNMAQAMKGVLAEIDSMVTNGVSQQELDDAKKSYAKAWEGRIAEDEFVLAELNQGLFLDRTFAYWSDLNAKIAKLSRADIQAAAKAFVDPSKLTTVKAGDLSKKK